MTGSGPGVITPDGCAVELYARLPAYGEPEIVHAAVPAGASILELGCGTGRLLRPLAALGHPVHGVDESPEMLAYVSPLPSTCAPIEGLRLGRTFDAVLLASTMINTADEAQRRAFLDTCRAHAAVVVIQRHAPEWFDGLAPGGSHTSARDGLTSTLRVSGIDGPLLSAAVDYELDGLRWTHRFTAVRLSDDETVTALGEAGLAFGRWLTDDRSWLLARVAG